MYEILNIALVVKQTVHVAYITKNKIGCEWCDSFYLKVM